MLIPEEQCGVEARALRDPRARHAGFLAFLALSVVIFLPTIVMLWRQALTDARYSHTIFIPLLSAAIICLESRKIFAHCCYCLTAAGPLFLVLIGYAFLRSSLPLLHTPASAYAPAIALMAVWITGFWLFYGTRALKAAGFPLVFLLWMVPLPPIVMDKAVHVLQSGSADVTYGLFRLTGVPVSRQGFTLSFPTVDIQIAAECSGIRSTIALFITGLLAGHLFLRTYWRQLCLALLIVPVVIFKNAVRIATITTLGMYVNPGFFHGRLHRYGGLPFSLLALGILMPLLFVLHKSEQQKARLGQDVVGGR